MISFGDIFVEVRQRVAAFKLWNEYYATSAYGNWREDEYLDAAYRFLNGVASNDVMEFFAEREGMSLSEYCDSLGVDQGELLYGKGKRK